MFIYNYKNTNFGVLIIKRIYDFESGVPSVKNVKRLPYPGRYHATIYDVCTRIIEPFGKEEFCLIVSYILVHTKTGDKFDFVETYDLYNGNSRIADFEAFLNNKGFSTMSDDDIIGVFADVDVVNECIGGFIHPVISYRRYGLEQALQSCGEGTHSVY